ncbi:Holliday junction resolvase [Aureimonas sp. Leaf454]|uniref:Holliday junction resolvase RuvX n=1 Tax=Aureimonas sp. Leaf454 TaxID=1736381 RepID=UPI0006F730F6|nr:Holliday junction resolvase RuvX [Aureimonas sp. Leaf454]KQT48827.1 Holliday junction resolvase [Aureimonas sp. Leaf454]
MAVVDIAQLQDLLPGDHCIAGLDLGSKTIGIAVSDLGWRFATPRTLIRRAKFTADAEALLQLLSKERCGAIVIGLPLNMDGSEGPRAQSTRAFVRNYQRLDERPIVFWDERLSTVAAERSLIGADVSRKKREGRIDSAAASFILQGALDRLSSLAETRSA